MKRLLYRFSCWLDPLLHDLPGTTAEWLHRQMHALAYWSRP